MIKCSVINDLLTAYISGSRSEETCALVDEHIAECESCRKTFMEKQSRVTAQLLENDEASVSIIKATKKKIKRMIILVAAVTCMAAITLTLTGAWIAQTYPSLGQIAWAHFSTASIGDDPTEFPDATDYYNKTSVFQVGEDIDDLFLNAQLKASENSTVYIKIINDTSGETEWSASFGSGNMKFTIALSDLKVGEKYSFEISAKNCESIHFGITPIGNVEFVQTSSLLYRYEAVIK